MTEKEEKAMLLASLCMLIAAALTVAAGLYFIRPVSGEASEQISANDDQESDLQEEKEPEEPYQELYYLAGQGFSAGTVTDANEKHAECFVILEQEPENDSTGRMIFIEYNDEFIIPEYDSRTLALDLHGYFTNDLSDTAISVAFSEDETLQDAMVPAVRIRTNADVSDVKPVLSDCMTKIFAETEKP